MQDWVRPLHDCGSEESEKLKRLEMLIEKVSRRFGRVRPRSKKSVQAASLTETRAERSTFQKACKQRRRNKRESCVASIVDIR
jgi:hypothetical protein